MLHFFPKIYTDEIAYSIFARYDVLSGNTGCTQTTRELFGINITNFNIFYPSHLNHFVEQLPDQLGITTENFIERYSIFPFFKPFMSVLRAKKVINNMFQGNTKSLAFQMGINSGDIFNRIGQSIKICPVCFKEEIDNGEAYAHRTCQIPGNFICEKHGVYLYEYTIQTNRNIFFDINNIDIELLPINKVDGYLKEFYMNLSQDINYVLSGGYANYDKKKIQLIYRSKLREKGYLQNTRINQIKLMDDFANFYPEEFLVKLESNFDKNNDDCWITSMANNKTDFIHPIRHMLFIRFLFGSANLLGEENMHAEYKPFGNGPWPCLNPFADHYKEFVIDSCEVKTRGKRKGIGGYFKCFCGFEYSRKGPDESDDDKFRYTSVSQRGGVWENKLRDLILNTDLSVSKLEKEMKCSTRTILKYANKMGVYDKLNTIMEYKENPVKRIDIDSYKNDILSFIKNSPNANRTQIYTGVTKQYRFLIKHDNDWLESVLPKPYKDGKAFYRGYNDKEWDELDKKVSSLVEEAVKEILNTEKNQRVTIKQIVNRINYTGLHSKNILDKLPLTKKMVSESCETLEQYRDRIDKKAIS